MKSLTFNRKQAINLQRKLIHWFLADISFHRKGVLNNPEHKKKNTLQKTQVRFKNEKSIHFTFRLMPRKNLQKREWVIFNIKYYLKYLTYKKLEFQNLSPVLFSSRGILTICFVIVTRTER